MNQEPIEIIVTDTEADIASKNGWRPFQFLQARFKARHNLEFQESDFENTEMFEFSHNDEKTAYRVIYKGKAQ
jgi:hypothetical protein